MIDLEIINKKINPLNERIIAIKKKFGKEILEELIQRIEITLEDFLKDFKESSAKSFSIYWNNQKNIKIKKEDINKVNKNHTISDKNIPKFISDYKDDDKKK